jgi:hypothetical protein
LIRPARDCGALSRLRGTRGFGVLAIARQRDSACGGKGWLARRQHTGLLWTRRPLGIQSRTAVQAFAKTAKSANFTDSAPQIAETSPLRKRLVRHLK